MSQFKDKLGDLSWLGDPGLEDKGWFDTGIPIPETKVEEPVAVPPSVLAWNRAKELLAESDWAVLPDVPMNIQERQSWEAYRKALREIRLQPDFPDSIAWPNKPE